MFKFILLYVIVSLAYNQVQSTTQVQYWDSFPNKNATECTDGKTQSPIDIPATGNKEGKFEAFKFMVYDKALKKETLKNTGHTAKMSFENDNVPTVSGGDLGAEYAFAQLHFHWGSDKTQGSEHTFGGTKYPMELHFVHYKKSLGDDLTKAIAAGKGAKDTLAVLGVVYEVQATDNEALKPIIDGLEKIVNQNQETDLTSFPLEKLLPDDLNTFYRYDGSLTTPACNELVKWTVFKKMVGVSEAQLAKFRALKFNTSNSVMSLENNYRLVQKLEAREIHEYMKKDDMGGSKNGTKNSATAFTVNILSVFGLTLTKVILF